MEVTIRKAERADLSALNTLIAALAEYEKLPPPTPEAQARFAEHGWPANDSPPRFSAWLAEIHDAGTGDVRAVAYAITFETYSSFLARPTLYMEDIFVLPDYRRDGVGSAMMQRLVAEAKETGCGRMEWVVLDWNTSAQDFYKKWGAQHLSEWHTYRLTF